MNRKTLYWILIIVLVFVFFCPVLLTLPAPFQWMEIETKERPLGDTIGGVTAPFLSALGSVLLFITIWLQIDSSAKQSVRERLNREYDSLLHDISSIKQDINSFRDPNSNTERGSIAIHKYAKQVKINVSNSLIMETIRAYEFSTLTLILTSMDSVLSETKKSKLEDKDKEIIFGKLLTVYAGIASPAGDIFFDLLLEKDNLQTAKDKIAFEKFTQPFFSAQGNIEEFVYNIHNNI